MEFQLCWCEPLSIIERPSKSSQAEGAPASTHNDVASYGVLGRDGGALHGTLTMRGESRPVRFEVAPATCDQPGIGCDVVAGGVVDRTDFGMDGWRVAVGDAVRFELRVRTKGGGE